MCDYVIKLTYYVVTYCTYQDLDCTVLVISLVVLFAAPHKFINDKAFTCTKASNKQYKKSKTNSLK